MNAGRGAPKTIDDYIGGFSSDKQEILQRIRNAIKEAAPDAEETIKYQIPTFVMSENLVHFAAFENHIGFYPTPSAIEKFKDQLSLYESTKGSVRFPIDKPVPLKLVKKIVAFRVREVRVKVTSKDTAK